MSTSAPVTGSPARSGTPTLAEGASKLPASSSSDTIAKGKNSKKPQPGSPETTRKKSKGLFNALKNTLGKNTLGRKKPGTTTSTVAESSDAGAEVAVARGSITTLSQPASFSNEILALMLRDIKMIKIYLTKTHGLPPIESENAPITTHQFQADVVEAVLLKSPHYSPEEALNRSVDSLINHKIVLLVPNWSNPLKEDRPFLEELSGKATVEEITASEKEYLETLYANLTTEDREALQPLSDDYSSDSAGN